MWSIGCSVPVQTGRLSAARGAAYHAWVDAKPPRFDGSDTPAGEPAPDGEATRLLRAIAAGDSSGSGDLLEVIYAELRRLAGAALRGERDGHTLQPTALVHEAWIKLADQDHVEWQSRAHFLGVASLAMRRVLVDHARARASEKRGGGVARERLHTGLVGEAGEPDEELDVLALDDALNRLAGYSERVAKVVELRFFGGLTEAETARVLDVARPTVTRDWRAARALLSTWLKAEGEA